MTVAVLGATGMVGSRVLAEATARGHDVLALSRNPVPPPAPSPAATGDRGNEPGKQENRAGGRAGTLPGSVLPIAADAGSPQSLRAALAASAAHRAADVVVLALRTFPADPEFLSATTRTVLDAAAELGIRVLVVGGAGALRSPADPGLLVADDPAYVPDAWRPVAAAGIAQLSACRTHAHADWVYLSPPALLEPGVRTGRYRRGTDTLLTGTDGDSRISAEDLAVAVLDELETPARESHFTVAHLDAHPRA
ncbi:NAD(P)-dependent oxidoreductase [Streptomyces sp. NPDC093225]|uniref:NAD(P)-dependent oxidoreductase n=1 Tax=Streptomyces sp. NPDC093225 TaxID=3366034 RepID=UPI0037F99986